MASVIVATHHATAPSRGDFAHERVLSLQAWLNGQWGIVMSHPDDFAPPPSTPRGFVNFLADGVLAAGVKPIAFGHSLEPLAPSWLDHAVNDDSVVLLDHDDDRVVDLAERALAQQLATLQRPFVLLLDEHGRCRATFRYRRDALAPPCTLDGLLKFVDLLRKR